MASLFKRVGKMTKVWLNDLLEPAEDPRQTFANSTQRPPELLEKVRHALGTLAESKTRLQTRMDELRALLPQLQEQARRALMQEREDLARRALQRRQLAIVELAALEQQWNELAREEHSLARIEQRLATQVESIKARQQLLAARYSAAQVQVQINEAMAGLSDELATWGNALEHAEQNTERMQARAAAMEQLVETGALDVSNLQLPDMLEKQLTNLNMEQNVQAQLASLRQELSDELQ